MLDVKCHYYMAGKYMDCRACSGMFISWDRRIVCQLADGVQARFPVVLTRKYACDQAVVWETVPALFKALCMSCTAKSGYAVIWTTSPTVNATRKASPFSISPSQTTTSQPLHLHFQNPSGFSLPTSETCGRGWTSFWRLQRPSTAPC